MAFIAGRIYLRYNVVTGRVECKAPLVPPNWGDDTAQDISSPSGGRPGGGCWTPLNDRIVNSLWKEMSQQQEKVVRVQDMYRVIESDFVPEFHPFRYYLEHLPPWDGQSDYILEMAVSVNVREVGRAMTDLGFRRMRSHGERGYVVVAYSADEVKARKRIKAYDAKPDEAGAVDTFDAIDTIF